MTIIYTFTYNGNIASYPKSIPSYHVLGCVDNIQGKFVTLADYNQLQDNTQHNTELIRLQGDTIKTQQVEIETLKGLLSRWLDTQEITLTATFYPDMMEKYESVISDTEKVLK